MTVAFAAPVAMDRPSRKMVVKNVMGRLLQCEESYSEAFLESADEQCEDEFVLNLNPLHSVKPPSEVYSFDPSVLSPNISPALQRNVRAWRDATGLPTTIVIRCKDRVFHLHKFPVVSRSGYLKKLLKDAKDVTIPSHVPGGPDILDLAFNFCYGSNILMDPSNIAEVCCVAEYLQMTEDYGQANLFERSMLYLTQVTLQNWDDTLVVLLHCENLAPFAEQLGIVRRCLDAMAFMACMEFFDPVVKKAFPTKAEDPHRWTTNMRETSSLHWWIQDVVAIPSNLFVKLVLALRREGMQENHVGQVIMAFADRWIFGSRAGSLLVQKGNDKCWVLESQVTPEMPVLIEAVVRVLPLERHVVPIRFLFGLLRRGLRCALHDDCRIQLETRIALQFEHATLQDLLLPTKKEKENGCVFMNEVDSMERILKLFLTRFRGYDDARLADMSMLTAIGKLWDDYLSEIAFDSNIAPSRFAELIERIPAYMRVMHDHVYRAIHAYLKAHPNCTQEERMVVCRTLNCQKLSLEACTHAVQNDLMPLRLIVQAMFMQQLQTGSVLASHIESASQSFRTEPHSFTRSILPDTTSSFFYPSAGNSSSHHACEYPQESFRSAGSSFRDNDLYIDDLMYAASQKIAVKEMSNSARAAPVVPPKVDYQVTESRLRNLEAELSRMRKVLSQNVPEHQSYDPAHLQTKASTSMSSTAHQLRAGITVETVKNCSQNANVVAVEGVESGMGNCGPMGCLAQMKPMNRTGGLFAKTLQKLRFPSFGKSKWGVKCKDPVISAPIVESLERASLKHCPPREALRFESEAGRYVGRIDSMPRPVSSHAVKPHHVRHKSIS